MFIGGGRGETNLISFNTDCPEGKIYGLESRGGAQGWL